MIYEAFKKMAFCLDPEAAHIASMNLLHTFPAICAFPFEQKLADSKYSLKVGRLDWTFPIGLAAGLDKNAEAIDFFSRIPFGAVEVGTITPKPQDGNTKPRIFRYPEEESLRNCMGFNNGGGQVVYDNILNSNRRGKILGINLGKNKTTSEDKAFEDYRLLYKKFCKLADYLVINISSPNTPGLRDLQSAEGLKAILGGLSDLRKTDSTPLYVKLSPDLAFDDLPAIISMLKDFNIEGIIATNTTIISSRGAGGVSGKLLSVKAQKMRAKLLELINGDMELIGVGGISSFEDLFQFWKMGGKVAQIYTSFIYQGPYILSQIKQEIDKLLEYNNLETLAELIENIEKVKRPI